MTDPDDSPPSPLQVFAIVPVVMIVAVVLRWLDPSPRVPAGTVLIFAAGSAALVGVPLAFWALDTGRTRFTEVVLAGAISGLLPIAMGLLSGVLGRYVWGGTTDYVVEYLSRRAPVPFAGAVPWATFGLIVCEGALAGGLSAAIYWRLLLRRRPRVMPA
ncbi:MAG: hypothetical protein IT184_14660 [Acidobacteria bacterium]|nr:hypothetical protein [Acidobacteriota bacterium]